MYIFLLFHFDNKMSNKYLIMNTTQGGSGLGGGVGGGDGGGVGGGVGGGDGIVIIKDILGNLLGN